MIYKINIETAGVFFFKKKPTGKTLCSKIQKRLPEGLTDRILQQLKIKGWENRPLPTLVCLGLGNPYGTINITCIPVEIF